MTNVWPYPQLAPRSGTPVDRKYNLVPELNSVISKTCWVIPCQIALFLTLRFSDCFQILWIIYSSSKTSVVSFHSSLPKFLGDGKAFEVYTLLRNGQLWSLVSPELMKKENYDLHHCICYHFLFHYHAIYDTLSLFYLISD